VKCVKCKEDQVQTAHLFWSW